MRRFGKKISNMSNTRFRKLSNGYCKNGFPNVILERCDVFKLATRRTQSGNNNPVRKYTFCA